MFAARATATSDVFLGSSSNETERDSGVVAMLIIAVHTVERRGPEAHLRRITSSFAAPSRYLLLSLTYCPNHNSSAMIMETLNKLLLPGSKKWNSYI